MLRSRYWCVLKNVPTVCKRNTMFVCGDDVFDSNAIMIGVRPEAYPLGRYIDGKMTLALSVFVYFRLGAHSFFFFFF